MNVNVCMSEYSPEFRAMAVWQEVDFTINNNDIVKNWINDSLERNLILIWFPKYKIGQLMIKHSNEKTHQTTGMF